MHTDEYEISIGREVTLCRKMVKQLRSSLGKQGAECGMSADEILRLLDEQGEPPAKFLQLRAQYLELRHWEKLLREYEEALRSLKTI
ncbi:MAG: hypothetical protein ABFD97_22495 [Syntrophobacter sp.]